MKKTLLMTLSLLLAFSFVLTSCSLGAPAKPKEVHLVMWCKEGGAQLDKVNALVTQFQGANAGLTIEVVNYDVEKLRENFQTSMLAGEGQTSCGRSMTMPAPSPRLT